MRLVKEVCRACRNIDHPTVEPTRGDGFDFRWDECKSFQCPAKWAVRVMGGTLENHGAIRTDEPVPRECLFWTEQVVGQE